MSDDATGEAARPSPAAPGAAHPRPRRVYDPDEAMPNAEARPGGGSGWSPGGDPRRRAPILNDVAERDPTVPIDAYQGPPPGGRRGIPEVTGGVDVEIESLQRDDSLNARPYLRRLEGLDTRSRPGRRIPWATVATAVALLAVVVGGITVVSRYRSDGGSESSAFGGPAGPVVNPTVDQLAQATVQLIGLDGDGEPMCSGSGTFVSADGMILTNAHVVIQDSVCDFASIGVAVTVDSGRPPELLYEADLLVLDEVADLAVVKISRSLDPDHTPPPVFPALALGDSDTLAIGDEVRILGYPEIGGDTITFTNGSVSGFTAQAGLGERALIKTDATIAGGNSGGAAVDAEGRLIGIPTKARASESGPAVDCRPLADTNGDGAVDSADNCVPIGGFLNGIRPINLARDLVDEARLAPPVSLEQPPPTVEVNPDLVAMSRPRFSLGEGDNAPSQVVVTAAAGVTELCLFVDWAGIPNGAQWDGIWWHNERRIDAYSLVGRIWQFGEEGQNFWMCAIDEENGLDPGLYELGFFLGGNLIFAEGIVLTEGPAEVIPTVWENVTESDVCGLAINPDGSGQVGLNELPPGQIIPPGGTITLDLPGGEAVVKAYRCDGTALADSAGTLTIQPDLTYRIESPGPAVGQ